MKQRDITHISLRLDLALAKAVRIQAINDGVSLKAWISQALIRRLAFEATALGDNNSRTSGNPSRTSGNPSRTSSNPSQTLGQLLSKSKRFMVVLTDSC
ncbi:MAG: type II toxin-antitoxin system HicB family antitoxin [Treponema sp.]|jgi:hypothetical protein|nr:type II toxin-antitoxin system HicB family antitoxin [Treponema sp.]